MKKILGLACLIMLAMTNCTIGFLFDPAGIIINGQNPGGGDEKDYNGENVEKGLVDMVDQLENGGKNEVTTQVEVNGVLIDVTMKKDGSGNYNVKLGNADVSNEYTFRALLYGVQKGIPAGKFIHLDLEDCYGDYINPVLGSPYVAKDKIIEVKLPATVTKLAEYVTEHTTWWDTVVHTFNGYDNLAKISGPGVTEIPREAFDSSNSLTEVNFPKVTKIGYSAFGSCSNLTTLNFTPELVTEIEESAFTECSSLTAVNFPAITGIKDGTFYNCTELATVTLTNSAIQFIKYNAFEKCKKLTAVSFPNLKEISTSTFKDCISLKTVDIPKVEIVGQNAFEGCKELETITFNLATQIKGGAFSGCDKLKTVNLPLAEEIQGGVFMDCTRLEELSLPKAKYVGGEWDTSNSPPRFYDGQGACFSGCTALKKLELPVVEYLGKGSFADTGGTTLEIHLPNTPPWVGSFQLSWLTKTVNVKVHNNIGEFNYPSTWDNVFKYEGTDGGGAANGAVITLNVAYLIPQ